MKLIAMVMAITAPGGRGASQDASLSNQIHEIVRNGARKMTAEQSRLYAREITEALKGRNEEDVRRTLPPLRSLVESLDERTSENSFTDAHVRVMARRNREVLEHNLSIPVLDSAEGVRLQTQIELLKHHAGEVIRGSIVGAEAAGLVGEMSTAVGLRLKQVAEDLFQPAMKRPLPGPELDRVLARFSEESRALPKLVNPDKLRSEDHSKLLLLSSRVESLLLSQLSAASGFMESDQSRQLKAEWIKEVESRRTSEDAPDTSVEEHRRAFNEKFQTRLREVQEGLGRASAPRAPDHAVPERPAAPEQDLVDRNPPVPEQRPRRRWIYALLLVVSVIGVALSLRRVRRPVAGGAKTLGMVAGLGAALVLMGMKAGGQEAQTADLHVQRMFDRSLEQREKLEILSFLVHSVHIDRSRRLPVEW